MDERAGRRDDHGGADVDGGLVEPDPVERLAAVLVHGRAGVVRRRPEGGGGVPVDRGARDAPARVARLDLPQRDRPAPARAPAASRACAYATLRVTAPRRRSRKPYASPAVASAAARAVTGICALPPGAIVTAPGTTIWTPLGCDCGLDLDRPGAGAVAGVGEREQQRLRGRAAVDVQVRVRERDRIGEELRVVRGEQVDLAGAGRQHRRLDRARRVRPRGRGRRDECRLDLQRRPVRVALEQERGGAGDVRRGHARPVEDGERAAGDRQRRGEDLAAGRADVRLQQVAEGGQAGGGEARDDAAAAGRRARAGRRRSGPSCGRRGRRGRRGAAGRRGRRSSRRGRRAGPGSGSPRPAGCRRRRCRCRRRPSRGRS